MRGTSNSQFQSKVKETETEYQGKKWKKGLTYYNYFATLEQIN